jgi:catechol 2,3-dioxygenase-like lactoylglutathione lyase family enzyme
MPNLSMLALHVLDVAASTKFYTKRLGFTLAEPQPSATDIVQIVDPDGDFMLLAGPRAGDLTPYLQKNHFILHAGETIPFEEANLDTLLATLHERGIENIRVVETRWGDRALNVPDPDGYVLSFITPARRSPEGNMAHYVRMVDELEATLAGLTEVDLNLSRVPGSWTIRQIVHHVADSDAFLLQQMKATLAEPGRSYVRNRPSSNELVPRTLEYAGRPIEPSITLFRAIREHIEQLVQHIPDAWERYCIEENRGRKVSFGQLLERITRHAQEHVDEILEIRRVHGL